MDRKRYNIILIVLGALAGIGPFSVDMYLPGFPAIAGELGVDTARVGLTLTSYFIGLSLGQLAVGPILDRYGRKRPLMVGLLLYIAAAVGCALAPSIGFLVTLRFFLALGVCTGMVGSMAIVRDLFSGSEVARAMSVLGAVFGIAPVIAPTIGGFVVTSLGWRSVFLTLGVIGATVLIAVKTIVPETRAPDKSLSLHPKSVVTGYLTVFKEYQFVIYALASAAAGGGLFAYITGSPFVVINLFGFTPAQFGWIFGGNAFLLVLGNQVNRILLKKHTPADILIGAISVQAILGLLLVTGTMTGLLGTVVTLALIGGYLFCFSCVVPNTAALALQPFSKHVGSASASMGSTQMISGAVASALVGHFHNGTAAPMVTVMAICSVLSLVLLATGRLALPASTEQIEQLSI